jgi:hypothetical protein
MSDTELRLGDVAKRPEQVAAKLWQMASDAMTSCHPAHLTRETDGESFYLVSPSISTQVQDSEDKYAIHEFAIAALINKKAKQVTSKDPLFLIIDGNITSPQLLFGKYTKDNPLSVPTDAGIKINTAGAENIVDQIAQAIDSDYDRRLRFKLWFWGIIVAIIVIGSVVGGILWFIDHKNTTEDEARAAAVAAYDSRNIVLNGALIKPGEWRGLVKDLSATLENVPGLGTIGQHPRSLSVEVGTCVSAGRIANGQNIVGVGNGPEGSIGVSLNADGDVSVCAIPGPKKTSYEVLLQLK